MVDPLLIIAVSIVLAVLSGALGLYVDIPYLEYGLPMTVLLVGSGIYTLQTTGVQGLAGDFATSIFVAAVSSFLTFLIVQGEK